MLNVDDEGDLPVIELQILLAVAVGEYGQFFNAENEDDFMRAERNDAGLSQEHVEVEVNAAIHQPRALDLRQASGKAHGFVGHGSLAPLLVQVLVDVTDRIAADGEIGEHLLKSQSVAGQGVVDLDGRLFVIKVGKVIEDVVACVLEEGEVFLHVNFDGRGIGRILRFEPREAGILNKLIRSARACYIRGYSLMRSRMSILILLCPPLPTLPSPPLTVCLLNGMRYVNSRSEKNVALSLQAVELKRCTFSGQMSRQHLPRIISRSTILVFGPEVALLDSQGQDSLMLTNNGDLQYE